MKKIGEVGNYEVFEVVKGDSSKIIERFHLSPASYIYEDAYSALAAIESSEREAYLVRYPYEPESMSDWNVDNLMHPLFVISAKDKDVRYEDILYVVPPLEDLEDTYFTDDGMYWGDDRWEPLTDILLGRDYDLEDDDNFPEREREEAEVLTDEILKIVYTYIHKDNQD